MSVATNNNALEIMTNKTIVAPLIIAGTSPGLIIDSGIDNTKQLVLVPGGTSSTFTTLQFQQSANRIVDFPDAGGNVVLDSATQTLSFKTIDSAINTVEVSGTNINSLVNQDVRTTSSPTFASLSTTGTSISLMNGKEIHNYWTTTSMTNSTTTTLTIGVATGVGLTLTTVATAIGTNTSGGASFRLTTNVTNTAGTVTTATVENIATNNGFGTVPSIAHVVSGTNILVHYTGTTDGHTTGSGVSISYYI